MHCLGPYMIDYITKVGEIKLSNLNGEEKGLVNGFRLYPDKDSPSMQQS